MIKLPTIKKLTKKQLIIGGLLIIVLIGVVAFMIISQKDKKPARKVVYYNDESTSAEEQLFNYPEGSKSKVCDSLPVSKIEAIISTPTNGPRISVPTTQTKVGSVSACAYIVKDKAASNMRTVLITERIYNDETEAKKAFATLTLKPAASAKKLNDTTLYDAKTSQLTTLDGKSLIVITIVRANNKETIDQRVFTSLASLM